MWEVTAEIGMEANNIKTVIVKANTKRKALIIGEKKLKEFGFVWNISAKEMQQKIKIDSDRR